jgi:hypothetical protein
MEVIEEINTVKGDIRILRETSQEGDHPLAAEYLTKVLGDDWQTHRWWFFDEFELKQAKQFGTRLLYDEEFRHKSRRGEAPWRQVHDTYWKTEGEIVMRFHSRDLLSFSPIDLDAEKQCDWATKELWSLLREAYTAISKLIRNFSLPLTEVEPYIEKQLDAAESTAAMIESSDNVSVEDIRSKNRLLEYRGNDPEKWVVEDLDHADRAKIVDIYLGEYEPVAALVAPGELTTFIKEELAWEKTHRTWHEKRECWELDLYSVQYTVNKFQKNHHTLRIREPVARICDLEIPSPPSPIEPKRVLPTMKLQQNEDFVSAIDFLLLPGVEPEVARKLLDEGFRSLCDLAHSSQKQINKTEDMSEQMAGVVKDGALAAVGEKEPAAVKITAETSVSLPEAKQVVEGLAASEIRPSDSAEALVEMAQSEIFDFESVNNRDLYYLFEAGFSSVDDILETNPSKLSDTYFISTRQAQAIQQEAKKEYKSN